MILRTHQRVVRKALLYDGLREDVGLMTISSSTILSAFLVSLAFLKTSSAIQTCNTENITKM